MSNSELINGISAVYSVCSAYNALVSDVSDPSGLERVACELLNPICLENHSLTANSCISNSSGGSGVALATVHLPLAGTPSMLNTLQRIIPNLFDGNSITTKVNIDFNAPFSILMTAGNDTEFLSAIAQKILLLALETNHAISFRCADLVMGGNFFTAVHNLISLFPSKTGGKVCTKQSDFADLIKVLESASASAMSKLGSTYDSVADYNKHNEVRINEYLTIIYLSTPQYHSEDYGRLCILVENGKKNGMSFILIGNKETLVNFTDAADYQIDCSGQTARIGTKAQLPIEFTKFNPISEEEISGIISSLQTSETIDSRFESHPDLQTPFFAMDSDTALRIPFAIDKNNCPLFFEIGGNAPAHALIAGSTGSGKSVALHTLIMQIVHNYHPDDVEIWAIDYKAVEFAQYLDHRTPHFRVIAHDTSSEFSLSLIDLLYEEYEKRQQAFLDAKVKDISGYRRVCGKHSMPRIVAIIDEFQLMTQAVQEYTGNIDYRTKLENLLRLTRAMGISFVLCSQTIASGLSGLSDAARDQIGCRLCLKHDDENEIRETLMLSGPQASDISSKVKELRRGQGIYKRVRFANEHSPDGNAYEFLHAYILYLNDSIKSELINTANSLLKSDYMKKDVILVRGGGRVYVAEKERHPISLFARGNYEPEEEIIDWYPAAPTTLADSFCIQIENTAAANILLVGEADDLRESIVVHSVCGFLMNPSNEVFVGIIDENYPDRLRMVGHLRKIHSERLTINIGVRSCLETIYEMKKIRPTPGRNRIYIWYGLDKLKNEIFLLDQEEEAGDEALSTPTTREDLVTDLMGFLAELNGEASPSKRDSEGSKLSFEDCKDILRRAFEAGPENNKFHFAIFNNRKSMKKSGLIELDCFENRIGTRMSTDDSYELFGSSLAINKTNDNTVIYYAGSGSVTPLRPYLLPDQDWYDRFNAALNGV